MRKQTNYALIAASLALSTTNEHQAVAFIPKLGISISPRFQRTIVKKSDEEAPKTELNAFMGNGDGNQNFGDSNPFNGPPSNPFNSPSSYPYNSSPDNPFNAPPGNPFSNYPSNSLNGPPTNPFMDPQNNDDGKNPFQSSFGTGGNPPGSPFGFSGFGNDENKSSSAADASREEQRATEAVEGLQDKTAALLRKMEEERLAQNAIRDHQEEIRREAEEYVQERKASMPRQDFNAEWESQSAARIEEAAEAARQMAKEMRSMYPEKDSGVSQTDVPPFGSAMPPSPMPNPFAQAPSSATSPPSNPFARNEPAPGTNPFAPSQVAPSPFGAGGQSPTPSTPLSTTPPFGSSSQDNGFEDEKSRREIAKAQFREQRVQPEESSVFGNDEKMNDFKAQQEAAIKAEEEAMMEAQRLRSQEAKRQEQAANLERTQRMESVKSSASTDPWDEKDPRQAAIRAAEEKARLETEEADRRRRNLEAQRQADQDAQNKRREEMQRRAAEENARLEAEIEEKRRKAKEAREAAINAAKKQTADEERRKREAEEDRKRKEEDRVRESRLRAEESRLKAEAERNRQEIKDYVQNRRSEADAWRNEEQDRRFNVGGGFPGDGDARLREEEARQWAQAEARRKYGGIPGRFEDEETIRVRNVYQKWAEFYGKRFDEQRFETFRRNLVEIERYYNNAGGPVQLNEFADLTAQEYRLRQQDPLRWEEEERLRIFEQERLWEEEQMMFGEGGGRAGSAQIPRDDAFVRDEFDPWRRGEGSLPRNIGPYPRDSAIDADILEQARRRGQYDAVKKAQSEEKRKSEEKIQKEAEKARIDELKRRGEAAARQKAIDEAKRKEEEEAKKRSVEEAKRRGEAEAARRAAAEAKRLEEEAEELEAKKRALDEARKRGEYAKQKKTPLYESDQTKKSSVFASSPGKSGGQMISDQREEKLQAAKQSIFEGAKMRNQQISQNIQGPQDNSGFRGSSEGTSPSDSWNIAMMRGQEAARKRAEAEAKLKEEEAAREEQKKAYFNTIKERASEESKRREEAAKKEKEEEEARKKRIADEAKKRAAEEEAKRAEAAARAKERQEKAAEDLKKAMEAANRKKEEAARKREMEAQQKREEQARIAQEQLQAREQARAKAAAEAKRKAEETARRQREQIELAAQERERQQKERREAAAAAKRKAEDIERNKAAQLLRAQEERNRRQSKQSAPNVPVNPFGSWEPSRTVDESVSSNSATSPSNQRAPSAGFTTPASSQKSAPAEKSSKETKLSSPVSSPFGSYISSLSSANNIDSKPSVDNSISQGLNASERPINSSQSSQGPVFPPTQGSTASASTTNPSFPQSVGLSPTSSNITTKADQNPSPPPPSNIPPASPSSATNQGQSFSTMAPFRTTETTQGPGIPNSEAPQKNMSDAPGSTPPLTNSPFGASPSDGRQQKSTTRPFSTLPGQSPAFGTPNKDNTDPINTSLDDVQLERLKSEAITKRQVAEAALKRAQELKQAAADELARKTFETSESGASQQEPASYMDKVAKSFVEGTAKLDKLNSKISGANDEASTATTTTSFGQSEEELELNRKGKPKGFFSRLFGGKENDDNDREASESQGNQGEGEQSDLPFFLSNMQAPAPASELLGDIPKEGAGPKNTADLPIIAAWGQTPEGSIYGFISNSPYFEDGAYIITTPVQKGATGGSIVETESGSQYRLAKE